MKLLRLSLLIVLFSQISIGATGKSFYIESWRKGQTQVKERTLNLNLNRKTSNYNEIIYDSNNKQKYKLEISSGKGGLGIIEWKATLEEISSKDKTNLLQASNDKYQDFFTWKDFPGWFYKGTQKQLEENNQFKESNAVLPFLSKRIIRIENFYCIFQVVDYIENKNDEVVLDSMTLQLQFANRCELPECNTN